MGNYQFLPGYCVLIADPIVESINALPNAARAQFLDDMIKVGDALLKVSRAWRINYSLLGNGDPTLHAHIQPRYLSEDEALRRGPIDKYNPQRIASVPFSPERDRPLMEAIRYELERTGGSKVEAG